MVGGFEILVFEGFVVETASVITFVLASEYVLLATEVAMYHACSSARFANAT